MMDLLHVTGRGQRALTAAAVRRVLSTCDHDGSDGGQLELADDGRRLQLQSVLHHQQAYITQRTPLCSSGTRDINETTRLSITVHSNVKRKRVSVESTCAHAQARPLTEEGELPLEVITLRALHLDVAHASQLPLRQRDDAVALHRVVHQHLVEVGRQRLKVTPSTLSSCKFRVLK